MKKLFVLLSLMLIMSLSFAKAEPSNRGLEISYDFSDGSQGWSIGTILNQEWTWGAFNVYNWENEACIWLNSSSSGFNPLDEWAISPVLDLSSFDPQSAINFDLSYSIRDESILSLVYRTSGGDWIDLEPEFGMYIGKILLYIYLKMH